VAKKSFRFGTADSFWMRQTKSKHHTASYARTSQKNEFASALTSKLKTDFEG
jgi:hypothetical protein